MHNKFEPSLSGLRNKKIKDMYINSQLFFVNYKQQLNNNI